MGAVRQVVGRTRDSKPISGWKDGMCFGNPTGVREGYCVVGKTDPWFQRFKGFGIFKCILLVNATVPRMKESKIFLHNFEYSCNDGRVCHVDPINFRNGKSDIS